MARTIKTFLVDGTTSGIKTVEFTSRIIYGISIPRKDFKDAAYREELKYSGVYFLIGEDDGGNLVTYVGQSKNLYKRLMVHYKDTNKDFRSNIVCFTNKDGSLNETDINYLEKQLIQEVARINNYHIVKNSNSGNFGLISESRIADMDEYISDLKVLITSLGYTVLKDHPRLDKKDELGKMYYLKSRGSDARGIYTNEGLLVKSGSKYSNKDIIPYQSNLGYLQKRRDNLLEKFIVKDGVFQKDYLFDTPTGACNVIAGGNQNGRNEWKNKEGVALSDIERI